MSNQECLHLRLELDAQKVLIERSRGSLLCIVLVFAYEFEKNGQICDTNVCFMMIFCIRFGSDFTAGKNEMPHIVKTSGLIA